MEERTAEYYVMLTALYLLIDIAEVVMCSEEVRKLSASSKASVCRSASKHRIRRPLSEITVYLSENEFARSFRLSRNEFSLLLSRLIPLLDYDRRQAQRSSGSVVTSEIRLACTLRLFAGGSVHDQMMLFGLARATVYDVFHSTVDTILAKLSMPGLPIHDDDALSELAYGFGTSRCIPNSLYGCVAALDGIAIEICKPRNSDVPRNL